MKKIKRKSKQPLLKIPSFLIGYSHSDPLPPGFLAAWFDREYGGPLTIRFPKLQGHTQFEGFHTTWGAVVKTELPHEMTRDWCNRLNWEHETVAEIVAHRALGPDRIQVVLHAARLARGLVLLLEGTSFDLATELYWNPSDWKDRPLTNFDVHDHVHILHEEHGREPYTRVFSRGMTKFALEDFETYVPRGLSESAAAGMILEVAEMSICSGKCPRVDESVSLVRQGGQVRIVRLRVDHQSPLPISFREIERG